MNNPLSASRCFPGQARGDPGRLGIADLDLYRAAAVLLKHHGEDAPVEVAMRADAMLEKGDLGG